MASPDWPDQQASGAVAVKGLRDVSVLKVDATRSLSSSAVGAVRDPKDAVLGERPKPSDAAKACDGQTVNCHQAL
jgi:hypothetical protein